MVSWDTSSAEYPPVLVHIEGRAAERIGVKHSCAEIMNKAERRDDE